MGPAHLPTRWSTKASLTLNSRVSRAQICTTSGHKVNCVMQEMQGSQGVWATRLKRFGRRVEPPQAVWGLPRAARRRWRDPKTWRSRARTTRLCRLKAHPFQTQAWPSPDLRVAVCIVDLRSRISVVGFRSSGVDNTLVSPESAPVPDASVAGTCSALTDY